MKLASLSFVYADYPRKQNNLPFLFYQKDKKYKHAVYLINIMLYLYDITCLVSGVVYSQHWNEIYITNIGK